MDNAKKMDMAVITFFGQKHRWPGEMMRENRIFVPCSGTV